MVTPFALAAWTIVAYLAFMDQKQYSKAEFQQALDELYQRNASAEIVIKADQRLKYGDVKEVFKMTKDAGFQDVGLIAEKKQKGS